jgi:acetyl-CoA synthetase
MSSDTALEETDRVVYEPPEGYVEGTNAYEFAREHGYDSLDELIQASADDVEWFWDALPEHLGVEWYEPYDAVRDASEGPQFTEWYPGGSINVAHNTVDRWAELDAPERNRVAITWEGEDGKVRETTYHELARQSNKVANCLRERGIEKGDTVGLYMPMVPEVAAIMYGIFKTGAIAVPIFSGFGVDATATRLEDPEVDLLFTADGFYRRGSEVGLKEPADEAIEDADTEVGSVVVYRRFADSDPPMTDGRDEFWDDAVGSQDDAFDTVETDAQDPCMLLYSSGTTGKPKGIVHTHAGAQMQAAKEIYFGFDHDDADRFFWVSDIGWMMGPWTLIGNHTFAGNIFMYEGAPDHPEPDRFWEMIDRHDLTVFGISPTAIRALRKQGDEWIEGHDLSSLRLLGSTGEPWDPESWMWFHENVGNGECPIINISGGTEIFGCFLMPLPGQPLKPCTLGSPGLGMDIDIVNAKGESIRDSHERGYLVARDSCPSMTKSLWSGDERYLDEYWARFDDMWDHGDWAQEDEDGFWFLHGRADDALNVAGRKVGPAEVEGALIDHDAVNAAAAIGVPDDTTGTAVVTFVQLEAGYEESDELREALRDQVGEELGKPFRPRELLFVDDFPMTQSGKIVRRVIQATHVGEDLGDLSSIENPDAIEEIEQAR